jgi:hypothetical protein
LFFAGLCDPQWDFFKKSHQHASEHFHGFCITTMPRTLYQPQFLNPARVTDLELSSDEEAQEDAEEDRGHFDYMDCLEDNATQAEDEASEEDATVTSMNRLEALAPGSLTNSEPGAFLTSETTPTPTRLPVPESFKCPITHDLMVDPVVDPEGNTYDRASIEQWLARNPTSPITRSRMTKDDLKPNRALADAIATLKPMLEIKPNAEAIAAVKPILEIKQNHAVADSIDADVLLISTTTWTDKDIHRHLRVEVTKSNCKLIRMICELLANLRATGIVCFIRDSSPRNESVWGFKSLVVNDPVCFNQAWRQLAQGMRARGGEPAKRPTEIFNKVLRFCGVTARRGTRGPPNTDPDPRDFLYSECYDFVYSKQEQNKRKLCVYGYSPKNNPNRRMALGLGH